MGHNFNGELGNGTIIGSGVPVKMQEDQAPVVTLAYPLGTQASPATTNVSQPSILWNQVDAALTKFTAYQVQVMDESGALLVDSQIVEQSSTVSSGSWTV
uniref:hypothetical protein n=1 Tax=Paenibacillus pini TaxID=669461 RepID=UPI000AFEE8B0